AANLWGLLSVLLLLVLGFRAVTPFALLMLFLTSGTMGTLVLQNLLFNGVNMIATAAALAVIGIGSDYGVIFLTAYQSPLGRPVRPSAGGPSRRERLKAVRRAMRKALESIGTATTVGCVTSAAAFLALSGADLVPLVRRLVGLSPGIPKGFQPIR